MISKIRQAFCGHETPVWDHKHLGTECLQGPDGVIYEIVSKEASTKRCPDCGYVIETELRVDRAYYPGGLVSKDTA